MNPNKTLIQSKFVIQREFILSDNSLKVNEKRFGKLANQVEYNLDEISFRKAVYTPPLMTFYKALGAVFLFWFFMEGNIFFTIIAFLAVLYFVIDYFYLSGSVIVVNSKSTPILFLKNRPNEVEVLEFIEELQNRIKAFLKWKYGNLDQDLPFDLQIKNYRWLRNQEVISDDEYDQLCQDLKVKRADSTPLS
jgi:hypothetical protein